MAKYLEELDQDQRPHRAGADTEVYTFDQVVKKAPIRTEYETTSEMILRVIRDLSVREWAGGVIFGFGMLAMFYIMLA